MASCTFLLLSIYRFLLHTELNDHELSFILSRQTFYLALFELIIDVPITQWEKSARRIIQAPRPVSIHLHSTPDPIQGQLYHLIGLREYVNYSDI